MLYDTSSAVLLIFAIFCALYELQDFYYDAEYNCNLMEIELISWSAFDNTVVFKIVIPLVHWNLDPSVFCSFHFFSLKSSWYFLLISATYYFCENVWWTVEDLLCIESQQNLSPSFLIWLLSLTCFSLGLWLRIQAVYWISSKECQLSDGRRNVLFPYSV